MGAFNFVSAKLAISSKAVIVSAFEVLKNCSKVFGIHISKLLLTQREHLLARPNLTGRLLGISSIPNWRGLSV